MNRSQVPRGLYKMHFLMIMSATFWGLLTGVAGGLLSTRPDLTLVESAWVVVGFALLSWLYSLAVPLGFQLYKYVLPTALPLVGTILLGITGMVIGYAGAMVIRLIGDLRRFLFIAESYARRGMDPPGVGPGGYSPPRDIIMRPLLGSLVAGVAIAWILSGNFGVTWTNPGAGTFASIVSESATGEVIGKLGAFCLMWGFIRQLFESGIDIWTTPRFYSPRL